jgi:pyrophosphatase PpaX
MTHARSPGSGPIAPLAPRAILVDLDGTIADTVPLFYEMSLDVFTAAGVPAPDLEAHRTAMLEPGSPIDRLFPADFPDRAGFFERLYRERFAVWLGRYERDARPIPGACEAVRTLHGRGYAIALVTSSMGALPFLDDWELRDLFATIVSRDHVANVKPHPEPLLAALERLGLAADEALHVGDSPLDVAAGKAAGTSTVGVLTGVGRADELERAGAVHVLPGLSVLPDLLREFRDPPASGRVRGG